MKPIATLLMSLCLAVTAQAADESTLDKAKASAGKAWDKTKEAVGAE